MLSNGVYKNYKGDLTWFLRVLMLMIKLNNDR